MKKKPVYRAYVVEDIDENNSFWTLVGSAFAHEDMKGFNLLLKALPTDGRLVLRRYEGTMFDKRAAHSEVKGVVKPMPLARQEKAH